MSLDDSNKYAKEFPLSDDVIYLNHAAVSPWPQRTADAVKKFADENLTYGASHYPAWINKETSLRKLLQKLINATSCDDIALLKNTSEALSVVAYGINWQHGDEVIITDQEFPSNRIIWESLKDKGVRLTVINVTGVDIPEQQIIDAIKPATRLVSISSVQYATGLRLDLEHIGNSCKTNNVLFCVDAIQSLGAFELDVQKIHADFVMADGHKWLMAPEGIALFYVSDKVRSQLRLYQYGWHMVENVGDFNDRTWRPAESARRFECGSPNMTGIHAMHASLELIVEVGLENIEQRVLSNSIFMLEFITQSRNLVLLSNNTMSSLSGIVSFRHKKLNNSSLFQYLTENKVICAQRGNGIRYSPHFYTPREKILQALQLAEQCPVS